MVHILSWAVAVALALNLRAEYFGPIWQVYLFKPLTTLLIIVLARRGPGTTGRIYRAAIIAGLVWSLAGDVFLMLPGDRFIFGLGSFLVAHLFYTGAFVSDGGFKASPALLGAYGLYYLLLITMLQPYLGTLTIPVAVYGIALATMGWQAAERWAVRRTGPAAGAALGALLFVVSDSVLALNRFAIPFRAGRLVIMTTYIAAQWLIARSLFAPAPSPAAKLVPGKPVC